MEVSSSDNQRRRNQLSPRREPVQARARERARQILDTTGYLLERVGLNDLTTILIAKELGVSVGSVYHYFPNKHAILYAMGEQWLASLTERLNELAASHLERLSLREFLDELLSRWLSVYREQRGLLPLVQAMWGVPELHELDERHDELVINHLMRMFSRLGFTCPPNESNRLARATLETCHAMLLVVVNQAGVRSERTREDLLNMLMVLLEPHRNDERPSGLDDIEAP
ncbi:TetR/AcrR family transcriptional regulator [Microbulbifer agarilyticus]|uniref:TetR/AcrR family transcriptional regulator n=1 Tax=Microbulbifer agarilyticus TaxID=260552 RepID=UPI001C985D5B|nr:TetR/AcrR family transcriptional regulator [Microbulbifer agarilyticus]MBY6189401.1 TetR/AcrR family transcriptional regulator [Microbulbifer agarilyticus]MBY6210673.1 TetR/AcrR family transcriptional regulator [Microbulbifer agarilyticus]MCA0891888.1 TetR/AcrR family transcriptional regulator [Microbulbifer agarilyticus]